MARGTLRCSLFLIFGLSSIASAVLDLVSRVGTQVGTPTPTLHARRHTRPRGGSRTALRGDGERARVRKGHPFVPSPLTLKLQTKL